MTHSRTVNRGTALRAVGITALLLMLFFIAGATGVRAVSTTLVINEVDYDQPGTDTIEFLEIKNVSASSIDLDPYSVVFWNASGAGSTYRTLDLPSYSLAAGDYYVICGGTVANCDFDDSTNTDYIQNGAPDALGLWLGGTLIDAVSYEGNSQAPYTEGSGIGLADTGAVAPAPAESISRCADGVDSDVNNVDFTLRTSTPGVANDCPPADSAPTVTSTSPADNDIGVAANTNITITFSEAVTVSGTISVVGSSSGTQNLTPTTGDNLTFTLDPADFTAGETVTVTVLATQVADQDGTPNNMAADYVFDFTIFAPLCGTGTINPIHDIQGNGATSPLDGTSVIVEAIVVGDFQDYTADPPNELSGFFVQEEDADVDADPNTSEGVFVFDGQNPAIDVAVGDKVRVEGKVDDFGDAPDTLTEIVGPLAIEVCSTGNTLPTPASVTLPVTALSDYEKYEGMAVSFAQELTVTEVYTLGRYGEVLLSQGGRLAVPTHAGEPGASAQAVRNANILRSIVLDDGLTNQNPDPVIYPAPGLSALNTLRGGDTTTGLSGVLTYFDPTEDFRIHPTGAVAWSHDNPRPAAPPVVPGTLTVVGMNTLNFFTTVDPGPDICGPLASLDCRGADSLTEFNRQRDKMLNVLIALDADIVGLNELENNAAANPANDGTDPVLESIVDGLNAHFGAGTYDFIDTGVLGGDAIKVGFIYKTATVSLVGNYAVLDSGVDPNFDTSRNRPALAQTFEEIASGEQLTVVVNHLKSKGSNCGGAPDDVPDVWGGNCNGTRTAAAAALASWLATDPTGSGDPDVLIIGDLNSYAKETPIDHLVAAGYTDLAAAFHPTDAYSYVFDGEWGYLDYGLSNATLTPQVTGAAEWHINADEPIVLDYNTEFKSPGQITSFYDAGAFRASDHDPMIVGLTLLPASSDDVFMSTAVAGSVGPLSFGSEDVLRWDGSAWSVWFDGSDAGLAPTGKWKHNLNAIYIPDPNGQELILSFTQNKRLVPGLVDLVDGMDLVRWDGSAFSVWFDGQDVGLTQMTQEKIDGLHVLDGSLSPVGGSCQAYLLISTQGPGRVNNPGEPAIKFGGEDVLGFCATNLGPTTTGFWTMVLDGSAEGMPRNATDSISASDDGSVIYLTTRGTFNVDSASGGHSMVYRYDIGSGTFSGPYFSAPANGLTAKVDGLQLQGDLP